MFDFIAKRGIILLNGNKGTEMQIKTPQDIAKLVRQARKDAGLTQAKLAKLCGVGTRFIVDLEAGKPTCQLDKTLIVLTGLGVKLYDEEKITNQGTFGILMQPSVQQISKQLNAHKNAMKYVSDNMNIVQKASEQLNAHRNAIKYISDNANIIQKASEQLKNINKENADD